MKLKWLKVTNECKVMKSERHFELKWKTKMEYQDGKYKKTEDVNKWKTHIKKDL